MNSRTGCRWIAIGFASVMFAAPFSVDGGAMAAPSVSQPATHLAGRTFPPTDLLRVNHETGRYACERRREWFCHGRTACTGLRCRPKYAGGRFGPEKMHHRKCGLGLRVTFWTPLNRRPKITC